MKPVAVLYQRLSHDTTDSVSIESQHRQLLELCERRGWEPRYALTDNNISGRVERARAKEAVELIRTGRADVLCTSAVDRFTRQGIDGLVDLSKALSEREASGNPAIFYALRENLSNTDAQFRILLALTSELARAEAENTSSRMKAALHHRRHNGRFAPNGIIPMGYRSHPADGGGRVLKPCAFESAVIREVAARIIAREPLARIARDLHARGFATSRSPYRRALIAGEPTEGLSRGTWTPTQIKAVWGSDSLLGRVTHRGKLITAEDGVTPARVWEPILGLGTLHEVRAAMNWKRPGETNPRPRRRTSRLLSSVAFCGVCGSRLYVGTSGSVPVMYCPKPWKAENRCPGVRILAEPLEELVTRRFLDVAGASPFMVEETGNPANRAELIETEASLREATSALMDEDADTDSILARVQALKARRAALKAAEATSGPTLRDSGKTLADAWNENPSLDWRRTVLTSALDHITVGTAIDKKMSADERRITFFWLS